MRSRKAQKASPSVPSLPQREAYPDQPVDGKEPHCVEPEPDTQEVTMDSDEGNEKEPVVQPPITGEQRPCPFICVLVMPCFRVCVFTYICTNAVSLVVFTEL